MQPTIETLQGQLLALRGFVASLIEVMPLHTRVQFAAKLDRNLELLRPTRAGDLLEGFGREMEALVVKRREKCPGEALPPSQHRNRRQQSSEHGGQARLWPSIE